jgi:hypothetical protein
MHHVQSVYFPIPGGFSMSVKTLIPLTLLTWVSIAQAQPCEFKRIDSLNESLEGVTLIQLNALAGELELASGQ